MIYCKTKNGKIVEVFESNSQEIAEMNGFTTPCDKEIVQILDGSYKFADEVTEDDFLPSLAEVKAEKMFTLRSLNGETGSGIICGSGSGAP